MFLGQYRHNIDEKGRLTIPSRFRELLLVGGAFIMQGFDQNLMVLPSSTYEAISHRVSNMSMTDPTARLLRRLIFSTADRAEIDKAGRMLVPQFLRQNAGMNNDVVLVGVGDYFEIWSAEQWSEQVSQLQDAQANAQRFSALDLSSN